MLTLILALVLSVVYFTVQVIKVIIHNRRAHKFFQTKTPKLPIVPDPNIFVGNINQTVWNMKNCEFIDKWHNELGVTYGFYFRSQPWVSTKDIDLIKRIEVDEAHKHLDRTFVGNPIHEFNTSIFQINGDKWRRVRRAIAPTLTNHKVRSDEVSSDIEQVLEQFVAALDRKLDRAKRSTNRASVTLNAHNYAQRITLAVIFLAMYKRENEVDFDADEDGWTEAFRRAEISVQNPVIKLAWALPFLRPTLTKILQLHPVGYMNVRVVRYINQAVDLHRSSDKRHPATGEREDRAVFKRRLIDGFIDALEEKKINHELFIGSAFFLLLAGFETTAATATCLLWHLARNLDIQTKLRETLLNDGIDADYVLWCILETVRWHPAVPLGIGRVLGADVTTKNGLLIPKGSFVMPSTYSIHHDESIWPQHDQFIPERWRNQSKFHPAAFLGFGLGPRNCVGGKLAIHELKLIIRTILTRYRVEACAGTPAVYGFVSPGLIYTVPDKPVQLQFTRFD